MFPWRAFLLVMLVALIARVLLLASAAVSFHSDEAIVGLMARHILQGERPTFFYGQAYMGSLDSWLVALGFSLLGESVLTIRIVQSVLYMLVVATGFLVAWRLSEQVSVAAVAGLVLAVPSVDVALYSTATLGGYNEVMLLGSLILLFGYDVTHEHRRSAWRWAALGACAGLGWWVNGLIVMYALPVGILILITLVRARNSVSQHVLPIALAILFFVVFSSPWWVFDFSHDHAALATFLTNQQKGEFEGIGIPFVPPEQRALGLALIGLPTLLGLKFPWEASYFLLPLGVLVLIIYGVAIARLLRGHNPLKPDARGLVLGMIGIFCMVFVASTFGADPTGRYFVVLALPFGIVLGTLVAQPIVAETENEPGGAVKAGRWGWIAVALVLGYHAAGQVAAARSPTGMTTQFDLVSHVPNAHDAELLAFLDEQGIYHGYTNYWVAFRLAFLSGERMQFSASLPYKRDLGYNAADNRYQPYVEATEQAERIAYITTNLPELDARLEAAWAEQGVTYQETQIGDFHVYYNWGFAKNAANQRKLAKLQ
jgi:4-amino-4-deoxy-L-arabinose transferase-like glycosyltransferase